MLATAFISLTFQALSTWSVALISGGTCSFCRRWCSGSALAPTCSSSTAWMSPPAGTRLWCRRQTLLTSTHNWHRALRSRSRVLAIFICTNYLVCYPYHYGTFGVCAERSAHSILRTSFVCQVAYSFVIFDRFYEACRVLQMYSKEITGV